MMLYSLSSFNVHFVTDGVLVQPLSPSLSGREQVVELGNDTIETDDVDMDNETVAMPKKQNYVSQSAVALRCRVMPPPCMRNPYLKDASDVGVDPFGNQRTKCAGTVQLVIEDTKSNITFLKISFATMMYLC